MKNQKGYSLVELLLAISVMIVIFGISLIAQQNLLYRSEHTTTAQTAARAIRDAQYQARAMKEDDGWGAYLNDNQIIVFKGHDFSTRDTAYDSQRTIPGTTVINGPIEITFPKGSGEPTQEFAFTIDSTQNNRTITVTVNSKGMVSY